MAITTICSGCGKTLAVADEFAGRQARCPQCGQIYTVPAAASTVAESPVDNAAPVGRERPFGSAPTDFGAGEMAAAAEASSSTSSASFWMKATNGLEYGPVDRATLGRWFAEGRVGAGYLIRNGEFGTWQPATDFQGPRVAGTTNPFAAYPTAIGRPQVLRQYPKADQSGLVLAMGILSWVGFCPIFGIVAWVVGSQALKDIQQGNADPTNRGLVQVGYYLGMISVILSICCFGFYAFLFAIMAIVGSV